MFKNVKESPVFIVGLMVFIAIIWGSGFPVTNMAILAGISPALLSAIRFILAASLSAMVFHNEMRFITKGDLKFGLTAGLILFVSFTAQTYGIKFTTPSNNALLTASNVVIVPFICWIAFKQRPSIKTTALALSCYIGMLILSGSGSGVGINFNLGDWLSIIAAFCYAIHITYLSSSVGKIDSIAVLSVLQMGCAGILSFIVFLFAESSEFTMEALRGGILPAIYLAIFPAAICFFLQGWVQRRTTATKAAIVFSTEGLFGSLLSIMMGYDKITTNLVVGGFVILASVMLTQVTWASVITTFKRGQKEKHNL